MRGLRAMRIGLAGMVLAAASPALAQPLFSVWKLVSTTPTGAQTARFGQAALEQRLEPAFAAELSGDAVTAGGKTVKAGTRLFLVYQADGQIAYCTTKDRSPGNAAKSLFIPALDKRPCLVDSDGDGAFDRSFDVFDKYGSALAPSGNLGKAVPLSAPVAFARIAPGDFGSAFRMVYRLEGKKDPAKARIAVLFDNGSGRPELGYAPVERTGSELKVLNTRFRFLSIAGETANLDIAPDDASYLVGESGGSFSFLAQLPAFLQR